MKAFDARCHLQDSRILRMAPKLIESALQSGEAGERGLFFVPFRTSDSTRSLEFYEATPSAVVGEIGLDKGSIGRKIDFNDQVKVLQNQLELTKELKKPASIYCVRAFGDLLQILKQTGPFPPDKAKKTLKTIPVDRILLKADALDALPMNLTFSTSPTESLNHPENIHAVLNYVVSLLDMPPEVLVEFSCKNAVCLFSYEGSKILLDKL
ncbi:hypothetical protein ACJRO7_034450 [Eucalyptus globulus]|uniref:Uncharacterized protein n=1 Tax=Eucalyptus globulus TaxID=34317 RepID=A0ABD3J910_EUCGL